MAGIRERRWWWFFGRPDAPDDDYRTTLLHILSNVLLVAMLTSMAAQVPAGTMPRAQIIAACSGTTTVLVVRWLMHRGRTRLGSIIYVACFWLASASLLIPEGWASPTTHAFFPLVVAAAGLLGGWGAVTFCAGTLIAVLVAGLAEQLGWIVPRPFANPQGIAIGWTAVLASTGWLLFVVVRELERNAQRARASAERYLDMVRSSPDAIIVFDDRGHLQSSNPALRRITGYTHDELAGMPLSAMPFLDDDARALAQTRFDLARDGRTDGAEIYDIQRKDGRAASIELSRRLSRAADGARTNIVVRDVTERRRAERSQRELELQLQHAQRMESIGRLAGGVAHEFNNCLTAIIGSLEPARRHPGMPAALTRDLATALAAAERAADVTSQLLAFGRADVAESTVLSVNRELGRLESMLRRLLGETISLTVTPGARHDRVLAASTQLNQIVVNLAVNAHDAMPDGGELHITTDSVTLGASEALAREVDAGDYVVLKVWDSGAGIDAATQARVFEPFFTTKNAGEGTGLGLSVVHGIVRRVGGGIGVDSTPGAGTTFTVYLPITDDAVTETAAAPPSAVTRSGRVLMVDDDAMVSKAIAGLLELGGYQVTSAASGDEAIARIEEAGDIDVLITDVILKHERGPDVAQRVRHVLPEVEVLYVSGYPADALPETELAGASFLRKPFGIDALIDKLDELMN